MSKQTIGLTILLLYPFKKVRQRGLIAGIARHHLIGQWKPFGGYNQSNDHLYTVAALVAAVTELTLTGKRRIAFKIGAGQVV